MAKQPKIRLAIEKWLKDNPDYKGNGQRNVRTNLQANWV